MDAYLQRLQEGIASATQGMSAEDLVRHPEGKWSTVEVLEHLYRTYTGTVKAFQHCLQAGKPLARTPKLKDRMRALVVTGLGHMPEGRNAPERTLPRGMAADEVTREIGPRISAMDDVITQCEARFGKRTRLLDHPVLGPLTARQWRKFHWVHGRHHLKQMQKLRQQSSTK
jgi:DinB superfamily